MMGMVERIISREREKALKTLLDDPSPPVREALEAEFGRLGKAGEVILRKIAREEAGGLKAHAEELLALLTDPDPSEVLVTFIQSMRYELETGLFLINRVLNPELDIQAVREELDRLAQRCREIRVASMNPRENLLLLNRVLFHEGGFRGNTEDYDDPLNSCLEAVLRRRKGLPILLSSVYILVGQRVGIDLEPIALPGHFLVGSFNGSEPLYVDPFERGRFRNVGELRGLLLRRNISPEFYHMVPAPVGEVLCRVCRNLVLHFEARKQARWADRFRKFVREFEETHRRRSEA